MKGVRVCWNSQLRLRRNENKANWRNLEGGDKTSSSLLVYRKEVGLVEFGTKFQARTKHKHKQPELVIIEIIGTGETLGKVYIPASAGE